MKIFSSIKSTLLPYYKAIKFVLTIIALFIWVTVCLDYINKPSTIYVIVGIVGITIAVVFTIEWIVNVVNNKIEKEKQKENEKI
jgi:hypothetical protein